MELKLRPYQEDTIKNVIADWSSGYTDCLVTMATGGGKTVVFLELLTNGLCDGERALIIAHRKELIEQPLERVGQFWPEWVPKVGVVMADRNEADKQITVATIQTLSSEKRLNDILRHGAIDYLVTDEAHHSTARTYTEVYDRLRDFNGGMRHLGVTATPLRSDGVGLKNVFEKHSAHYGIKELVKLGWLCPPRWLAVQTDISLRGIRVNRNSEGGSDYSPKQLANVFETDNCFDLVVETHQKYANERQALAFTVSVDGAHRLAQTFRDAGISAEAIDGTTPKVQRSQVLGDYKAGNLQVVTNCQVLTEGFDAPETSCIHHVRPTQSDSLYVQMMGRGLRPVPGKSDALILDYLPKDARNIVMAGNVLGGKEIPESVYMQKDPEPGEIAGGFTFDQAGFMGLYGDPADIVTRELDYLSASPWRWKTDASGWLFIGMGPGDDGVDRTLAISPVAPTRDLYLVYKRERERWHSAHHWETADIEILTAIAEDYLDKKGNPVLMRKAESWRHEPATGPQINFAKRLGCWQSGMSRGDTAHAITAHLALGALRRAGALEETQRKTA